MSVFLPVVVPLGIIITHVVIQQSPSRLERPNSLAYLCHHSWAFQLALTFGLIPGFYTSMYELLCIELDWTAQALGILHSLALGFVGSRLVNQAFLNARDDYRRAMVNRSHGPIVNIRLVLSL